MKIDDNDNNARMNMGDSFDCLICNNNNNSNNDHKNNSNNDQHQRSYYPFRYSTQVFNMTIRTIIQVDIEITSKIQYLSSNSSNSNDKAIFT